MNIIFPIHPRTKKTLENFNLFDELNELEHVHIIKPLGYLDFLILTSHSTLILTDSGGLQEEAITLDVPVLTLSIILKGLKQSVQEIFWWELIKIIF